MTETDRCPSCDADFQGEPIPEKDQDLFGGARFFSTLIAVYDQERDRTVAWRCPFCNHEWPRAT